MNREREEMELASSSVGENQLSILGKVVRGLKDIENETPGTLERILTLRRSGASDQDVGAKIVEFLQNTSLRLNEVTNRGYQRIEISGHDAYNREQALNYWRDICNKSLSALKVFIENYFEQKLHSMESNMAQQIQIGSSNFRTEIEGYLNNDESTFEKMNVNLGIMLNQVSNKFHENDGRSEKFEWMLIALIEENKRTQQILEYERREREKKTAK